MQPLFLCREKGYYLTNVLSGIVFDDQKTCLQDKKFAKWMRKTELKDQDPLFAIAEMEAGLINADLGGNVFKKRIALPVY